MKFENQVFPSEFGFLIKLFVMEDYEDLDTGPDQNGQLNLAFHNWDEVPSDLYSHAATVKGLNFSHNRILDVPKEFGNLVMIRELDLSHNKLYQIDPVIMLRRLRVLNLSHNCLSSIPENIACCAMLVRITLIYLISAFILKNISPRTFVQFVDYHCGHSGSFSLQ